MYPPQPGDVWVRFDGVLSQPTEVLSPWLLMPPQPHAEEVLRFASALGRVFIYGEACAFPRGQRAVQRWIAHEMLGQYVFWVSERDTPPDGADRIDQWPMGTTTTASGISNSDPEARPLTDNSRSPPVTDS